MRHYALAKCENDSSAYLCDVFLACEGFIEDALNNTSTEMVVTCVQCLTSRFKLECHAMDLDAIDHLDNPDLLDHFVDRDAMALGFRP